MIFNKIQKTIEKHNLIKNGDKIILAVSGGPDSVILVNFFAKIKDKYRLNLHLLHINHKIRKDKVKEEAVFVKKTAEKLSIPFHYYEKDAPRYSKENKISLEEAARNIRRYIYAELKNKLGADKVATGHNLDDKAETVIMRIIRGTSPAGLTAIKPSSEFFIRPLIECGKDEITDYLRKNKIKYVTDESNKDIKFFRNKIRHNLIPLLEAEYNPNIKECLIKLSALADEDESFLENMAEVKLNAALTNAKENIEIDINKLLKSKSVIVKRAIKLAVKKMLGHAEDITNYHYEKIYDLIKEQKGHKKLNLPNNLIVEKIYDRLIIKLNPVGAPHVVPLQIKPIEFSVPGSYDFPGWNINLKCSIIDIKSNPVRTEHCSVPTIAYFDMDKIPVGASGRSPLLNLRARRAGDYFVPFGMKGRKKLQDFFTDIKLPKEERDKAPIITAGNEIIWVVGHRISEKYKVTKDTKRILQIKIKVRYLASQNS